MRVRACVHACMLRIIGKSFTIISHYFIFNPYYPANVLSSSHTHTLFLSRSLALVVFILSSCSSALSATVLFYSLECALLLSSFLSLSFFWLLMLIFPCIFRTMSERVRACVSVRWKINKTEKIQKNVYE